MKSIIAPQVEIIMLNIELEVVNKEITAIGWTGDQSSPERKRVEELLDIRGRKKQRLQALKRNSISIEDRIQMLETFMGRQMCYSPEGMKLAEELGLES